jgi:hypothetical protein
MDPKYDQLIEPPRIPFSFGAPGWWVLGSIILILLVLAVWLLVRHRSHNRYRRIATALLEQCTDTYSANMLLKRVAITAYPRNCSAALRAADWISFLNTTRRKSLFDKSDADTLSALYNRDQCPLTKAFRKKMKEWIKHHHPHAI